MDMLSYFLGRLANGEGGGESGPIYIGGVLYTDIEYKDDNTVILTEEDGIQHTIRCVYSEDKLQTLYYDETEISLTYNDEGELVKIGDTIVDMSIAPVSSGSIELIEQIIDESGVLDSTEGTATEKVGQLIDRAEDENLWYEWMANAVRASQVFYNYSFSRLPRLPALKVESLLRFFAYAKIETIDFYIDIASTNIISMSNAFADCPNLASMVGINTLKGDNLSKMFTDCMILETIQEPFDFSNATDLTNIFYKCYKLKEIRFVKETIKLSLSLTYSSLLSEESIQSIIDGLATVTTAQTLTLNSAITITDEQKATINEKGWTLVQ